MKLDMQVGLGLGHIVLDGDPAPPRKGAQHPPLFGLCLLSIVAKHCCMDKMPLGTPPERGTAAPAQFLVHVYCGQMAGWIRIPLGTEVDLGPGDSVLDGVPAPPTERGCYASFYGGADPCLLWPNGRPSQQLLTSCYGRPM